MKKTLLLLSSLSLLSSAIAAPGDTTTVIFHDLEQLSWYENYDQSSILPDGSLTYNKIILEFELGKYPCDGYDPNNPGEGSNNTGWCADWDYDVHVQAINADDEKIDLGRLITPYANSNFPRTPADWSQSYFFDVTDYYSFLKDEITLRIFYAGWSGGFTGTTKLHFIEGPRTREVLNFEVLYLDEYAFGDATSPINEALELKTLHTPQNADHGEVKVIITGHGSDPTNCAEFCSKNYTINMGGQTQQQLVWRDDCGSNFLYPQSGTWIWDRANWCPGDQVAPILHAFNPTSGEMDFKIDFENYTANSNAQASYKLSATVFFYGPLAFNRDAGIEVIMSPTMEDKYFRYNPSCEEARILVKNYGSEDITSLEFEYSINGSVYTTSWSGNIASLASQEVVLNIADHLSGLDIQTAHDFSIEITLVNGQEDEQPLNNTAHTSFLATPEWEGGDYEIELKTSSYFGGQINNAYLYLYDENDQLIFDISNTSNNNTIKEQIKLTNGCYRLEVSTPLGGGLRFFNMIMMGGHIKVKNLTSNGLESLPKNDFTGSLAGNFGNGFTQYFEVINSEYEVSIKEHQPSQTFSIFPNPAQEKVHIKMEGAVHSDAQYKIFNILGQKMMEGKILSNNFTLSTEQLNAGHYFIEITNSQHTETLKLIIK